MSTPQCDGRLILPHLGANEWKSHDSALKVRLSSLHSALSMDVLSPSEAARDFSSQLADFLGENDVFRGGEGEGRGGSRVDISDEAFIQAKREKKRLQRLVFGRNRQVGQELRAQFYQAVKLVSHIRRQRVKREQERESRGQEKSFF